MAIATCVLTCKSWFCMSRITCLIIFSGSSALSIKSLRLARTNVETRSSNAMVDSFFELLALPLQCQVFFFVGSVYCRALGTFRSLPSEGRADCYSDGDSDGEPEGVVSSENASYCSQSGA